jgi:hypothetical protein
MMAHLKSVILIAGFVMVCWNAGVIRLGAATTPAEAAKDCFIKERRLRGFFRPFSLIFSFSLKEELVVCFLFFMGL